MFNIKGYHWNSVKNSLPKHWNMRFVCTVENIRALRFTNNVGFFKRPKNIDVFHGLSTIMLTYATVLSTLVNLAPAMPRVEYWILTIIWVQYYIYLIENLYKDLLILHNAEYTVELVYIEQLRMNVCYFREYCHTLSSAFFAGCGVSVLCFVYLP